MQVSEIDFSRVPHKTIRLFLESKCLSNIEELASACYSEQQEPYAIHSKSYVIPAGIDEVWDAYLNLHPTQCWDSRMVSFGLMYSRTEDAVFYRDSTFASMQKGQLYFINLKILGSLFQIPVTHEVNDVDTEEKVIQSCYLAVGKSIGSQWIRLFSENKHTTKVVHETRYKCDSKFREKYLYPLFHTKAINQFHGNVIRAVSK